MISILKFFKLFRNAEKIDFIFVVTYVMNLKLKKYKFKHFKKIFEK